jgi:phycoerythrobilin:ferredoxin oxidoreductase
VKTGVFVTLKDYLAAELDLVDRAQPVTASSNLDSILQAQLCYLRYRAEKKPGRGMLKRFCGEESTKRVYSRIFVRLGTEAATIGM